MQGISSGDIGVFLAMLVFLAGLNERVLEEVAGSWMSGKWAKLISLGAGVGLTYASYSIANGIPELKPLTLIDPKWLWGPGIFVGLGSNVVHALTAKLEGMAENRIVEKDGTGISLGPLTIPNISLGKSTPAPPPSPEMNPLLVWTAEANAIYHNYMDSAKTPADQAVANAAVAALTKKYPTAPPIAPGWPVNSG